MTTTRASSAHTSRGRATAAACSTPCGAAPGRKSVVVLKGGRTGAGSRTAASHTAALAGTRQVWSAALRQAGAVEVATFDELIDMLVAFAFLREVAGADDARPRVGVVGGGGGRAVQSADVCEEAGLAVPGLPDTIRSWLRRRRRSSPSGWTTRSISRSSPAAAFPARAYSR